MVGQRTLADRSAQLSAIWQEEGQWLQADVAVQMQRLTLDIVGMVAFSHNFGQVDAMQKLGATAGENEIPTDRILHDINVAQVRACVRSRLSPTSHLGGCSLVTHQGLRLSSRLSPSSPSGIVR